MVVDDEDRENEGDLIFAAAKATPELMAFTIRHSSGVICVPMPADDARPARDPADDARTTATGCARRTRSRSTPATASRTGICAADRAHTARMLADSATEPWEITRPGPRLPAALPRGRRAGAAAATPRPPSTWPGSPGSTPAGVLVEIVNDDGTMKRAPELREFADEHGLAMISIERPGPPPPPHTRRCVERVAETRLPTGTATSRPTATGSPIDGSEHLALVYGDVVAADEPVLTRVHSECLTGDVFGSQRCDCGPQLDEALERIVAEGRGVVVYLRGHEGRGIGLVAKLQAYAAPGRRPRHRRRQPRPRAARRRPPLRRRDPGPARPRRRARCGC